MARKASRATASTSPTVCARAALRELAELARPSGEFDARRYFRDAGELEFYNVGTPTVRALARRLVAERPSWTVDDALAFAGVLLPSPVLEAKGLAIEVTARYRKAFRPALLTEWKRWLADGLAANWATTDAIAALLTGPLLLKHPELAAKMTGWAKHRSLWVRRASVVSLLPLLRKGQELERCYGLARMLGTDREDLMQKAVGWVLREAGKADDPGLRQFLLDHGRELSRTTLRYATERLPVEVRRKLLADTR